MMVRQRRVRGGNSSSNESLIQSGVVPDTHHATTWKRVMLLVLAITVHNIPEGLAVGVGFGAVGKAKSATFESARNLALGTFKICFVTVFCKEHT